MDRTLFHAEIKFPVQTNSKWRTAYRIKTATDRNQSAGTFSAQSTVNGRGYNRTIYLQRRATMMQQWADYLDKIKMAHGADVIRRRDPVQGGGEVVQF